MNSASFSTGLSILLNICQLPVVRLRAKSSKLHQCLFEPAGGLRGGRPHILPHLAPRPPQCQGFGLWHPLELFECWVQWERQQLLPWFSSADVKKKLTCFAYRCIKMIPVFPFVGQTFCYFLSAAVKVVRLDTCCKMSTIHWLVCLKLSKCKMLWLPSYFFFSRPKRFEPCWDFPSTM